MLIMRVIPMYESFQWFTETIDYESKSIPQLSNAEFGLNPISAIKALKYRIVLIKKTTSIYESFQ